MAFELENWMKGVLAFGVVVLAVTFVMVELQENYGVQHDDYNGTFGNIIASANTALDVTQNDTQTMRSHVDGQFEITDIIDWITGGAYRAIRLVFGSIGIAYSALVAVGSVLFLPAWLVDVAITGLILSIIWAIIYLIFKMRS